MLSRVADNLYWMSRYLERAEHGARLVDVHLNLALDLAPEGAGLRWRRLAEALRQPHVAGSPPRDLLETLVLAADNPNSIGGAVATSRENARQVREQVSSEMWEQLNTLHLAVSGADFDALWPDHLHGFLVAVREGSHLFQGLTDSTASQDEGWYFIQLGRYLERALGLVALLGAHTRLYGDPEPARGAEEYLEWVGLLRCCTAFEAYCRAYTADVVPRRVVGFLLLDADFPHSLHFCVDRVERALRAIAERTGHRGSGDGDRIAGRLHAALRFGQIDEIADDGLGRFLAHVERECEQIHAAIYERYISYAVDIDLPG